MAVPQDPGRSQVNARVTVRRPQAREITLRQHTRGYSAEGLRGVYWHLEIAGGPDYSALGIIIGSFTEDLAEDLAAMLALSAAALAAATHLEQAIDAQAKAGEEAGDDDPR